jgi:hypothetical protein
VIYLITTRIGEREKVDTVRFYSKMEAVTYYRLKLKEMAFPDTIDVGILNDGN